MIDIGILALFVAIVAVAGLGFMLLRRRPHEDNPELASLLGDTQQILNDRFTEQERTLREMLTNQERNTTRSLGTLNERLAIIREAQKNIADLSEQVTGLRGILDNKQARGAFGEFQLEELVSNALPSGAYQFQATLSNGKRADCLLKLPDPPGPTVIDSKFPLESYRRLIEAPDADARKICRRQFAGDIATHLDAIAQKYIITGETSENALMFVPSESIYSEIHSHHEALVRKSYRSRVYIVSPSTLWATMNTMRAIFRDVHMREQADIIQNEVVRMLEDVGRLDHRINSLERTYSQMGEEFRKVRISTDKIIKRGAGIEALEFDQSADPIDNPTNNPTNT
jgi:DNA recombination protein RmuC